MMTNLFSMFDPSTTFLYSTSLNWFSTILFMFLLLNIYWFLPNNIYLMYLKFVNNLFNEFKIIVKKKNNNFNLLFISLFFFIMMNNFLGLFPYIFTSTSHLSINLSITLPMWFSMMCFGWINKINHMFTHLVPQGTPNILIPFMIFIETISLLMRPITLTIRLTANMIAGHLLLTLLGNMGSKLPMMIIPTLLSTQMLLLFLESAVTFIQAYVFAILMTLYTSEI